MKPGLLRAWYSEAIAILEKREHVLLSRILLDTTVAGSSHESELLENIVLVIMAIESMRTRIALISEEGDSKPCLKTESRPR